MERFIPRNMSMLTILDILVGSIKYLSKLLENAAIILLLLIFLCVSRYKDVAGKEIAIRAGEVSVRGL